MATLQKFNSFMGAAWNGKFAFNQGSANLNGFSAYKFKAALSNTLPVATNSLIQHITEITAGAGYTTGGNTLGCSLSITAGVTKVIFSDTQFTAVGGAIGPFQYIVVYVDQNDANTLTATDKYLIGWLDTGSPITLASSQGYLVDFDQTAGAIQYTS